VGLRASIVAAGRSLCFHTNGPIASIRPIRAAFTPSTEGQINPVDTFPVQPDRYMVE
jgi:hypothetical protein